MTADAGREPSDIAQMTFGIGAAIIGDRNDADEGHDGSHTVQHEPLLERRVGRMRPERLGAFGKGEEADRRFAHEAR